MMFSGKVRDALSASRAAVASKPTVVDDTPHRVDTRNEPSVIVRMDNTPAAKNLAMFLEKMIQPSRAMRVDWERKWVKTYGLINGRFDLGWDPVSHKVVSVLDEEARIRAVNLNYLSSIYLTKYAHVGQVGAEFNVSPANVNDADVTAAETAGRLLYAELTPELERIKTTLIFYTEMLGRSVILPVLLETGYTSVPCFTHVPTAVKYEIDGRQVADKQGQPLYYELTESQEPKQDRIPNYKVRLLVMPPFVTLWDPRCYTPDTFRDSRFICFERQFTRAELVDIHGRDDEAVAGLSYNMNPDMSIIEQRVNAQVDALTQGGVSFGTEPTVKCCEFYIAPRKWAQDEFQKWWTGVMKQKLPGGALDEGLHVILDPTSHTIVYAAKFPPHAHGKIENICVPVQQNPIYSGTYVPTTQDMTADLQRELSMIASDLSEQRKKSGTINVFTTGGAPTTKPQAMGEGLVIVDVPQGAVQPMAVVPNQVGTPSIRWMQQMEMDLQQIVGTSNLVLPTRTQTATEINAQEIASGRRADLSLENYARGFVQVAKIHLEMVKTYCKPTQIFRILGTFDTWKEWSFRREELDGNYDIVIESDRWAFGSPTVTMMWTEKLVQMGVLTDRREIMRLMRKQTVLGQTFEDCIRRSANENCRRICTDPLNQKDKAYQQVKHPVDGTLTTVPSQNPGWRPGVYELDKADIMLDEVERFWAKYRRDIIQSGPLVYQNFAAYREELMKLAQKQSVQQQIQANPMMLQQMAMQNASQEANIAKQNNEIALAQQQAEAAVQGQNGQGGQ